MEKKRGTTLAVVAALIIAIISLGVAFAAFSTTLTINGSATVEATTWDIHFQDLSAPTLVGGATIATAPTLTATEFSGLVANFKTPGDSVSYTWKVKNAGSYNATLATDPSGALTPKCAVAGDETDQSAINVCSKLTYTVTGYNSSLASGAEDTITLTLTYVDFEDEKLLPKSTVTVTLPQLDLIYTQDGTAVN